MHSTALILSLFVMVVNTFAASYYHGGKNIFTNIYGDGSERLVDGTPTTIDKFPYVIAIKVRGDYFCGGSIIASNFILTAAHCVLPLIKYNLKQDTSIVAGTTYLNKGGHSYKVADLWYYEKYDVNARGRTQHDIGMIELTKDIIYGSTQQPIKLPTSPAKENDAVTIAAWGRTGRGQSVHNDLRKIDANVILPKKCQSATSEKIGDNELCTYIKRGRGTCNGDSGSGLIQNTNENKTIVALVSGGKPCAIGYPDVYTATYPYVAWINEKMGKI